MSKIMKLNLKYERSPLRVASTTSITFFIVYSLSLYFFNKSVNWLAVIAGTAAIFVVYLFVQKWLNKKVKQRNEEL